MSRLALILALALGVAIGFTGGWVASGGLATTAPALGLGGGAGGSGPSAGAEAVAGPPGTPLTPSAADAPFAPGGAAGGAAGTSAAAVADAAAGAPDAAAVGTGTISGRVTTDDGTPVPGVLIRAVRVDWRDRFENQGPRPGDGTPPTPGSAEDLARYAAAQARRQRATRETLAGPDGRYAFADLPEQGHMVSAWAAGHACTPSGHGGQRQAWRSFGGWGGGWGGGRGTEGQWVEPGATLDFLARPLVPVRFALTGPDGAAIAEASLTIQGPDWNDQDRWSPERAVRRLPPGTYKVWASATFDETTLPRADSPVWKTEEQPLVVTAGAEGQTCALRLTEPAGIRGRVTDPSGGVRRAVTVWAARLSGDAAADADAWKQARHRTNARGPDRVYAFTALPKGRYQVGAMRQDDEAPGGASTVDVGEGMATCDLVLSAPTPEPVLIARVTGPDGKPVGDVQIGISGPSGWQQPRERTREPDGAHRCVFGAATFRLAKPDATPEWRLVVISARLGTASVPVAPGQAEARVAFAEPAMLTVTVAGYRGSGLEGDVSVWLAARAGAPAGPSDASAGLMSGQWQMGHASSSVDADGKVALGPVTPGERDVVLGVQTAERHGGNVHPAVRVPIALRSGPNAVTLSLPALHTLVVQCTAGAQNNWLSLSVATAGAAEDLEADGTDFGWVEPGEDGRVTFERIPAGRYRINRWDDSGEGQTMTVTVPAAGPVRWQADARNAVKVAISDAEGPLAKAGLKADDVIVTCDGEPFADWAVFLQRVSAAGGRPAVTLGVRRGEATTEVAVPGKALLDAIARAAGAGGTLRPIRRD